MRTLYVSDLDGTLLNRRKEITPQTAEILNRCIDEGMLFSVATARMPYGCDYRLEEIRMKTPGILTNGVFLYDFSRKKYLDVQTMEKNAVCQVLEALKKHGLSCFLYSFLDDQISIYYEKEEMETQTQYYSSQALKSCRQVRRIPENFAALDEGEIVYLALTGEEEQLRPVLEEIGQVRGLKYACYLNIYNGLYCLEIFSEGASKKNALQRLKERTGCQELVVFGDNFNDLPMIEIADRSYAPANALEEIKRQVTGVLEDCDHDGVAKFLESERKKR